MLDDVTSGKPHGWVGKTIPQKRSSLRVHWLYLATRHLCHTKMQQEGP